ncbi:MAG: BREX-3 system P-loop-containing protein BrxF [Firmicutes bacterium]|nr:BREX-3 system P-loop-containing protein BrxF [Bacillota bacterium]
MSNAMPYQLVETNLLIPALQRAVTSIRSNRVRLILLVASSGKGKTKILQKYAVENDFPLLSLGLLITKAIQEGILPEKLIIYLRQEFEGLGETVLLDNIEVLFQPSLRLQVLQLLKLLSRERTLIATFPGRMIDGSLVYAEASYPEYKVFSQYEIKDFVILDMNGELK